MKNSLKRLDRGFSQIFLLLGMLLVAVSLPIATSLVQQSQENRSSATTASGTLNTAYITITPTPTTVGVGAGTAVSGLLSGQIIGYIASGVTSDIGMGCSSGSRYCSGDGGKTANSCINGKLISVDCTYGCSGGYCTALTGAHDKSCYEYSLSDCPDECKVAYYNTFLSCVASDYSAPGVIRTPTATTCSGGDGKVMCQGGDMYSCNTATGIWNVPGTPCANGCDTTTTCKESTSCVELGGMCDVTCNYGSITSATDCTGTAGQCCSPKPIGAGDECSIVGDYTCDGNKRLLCIYENNDRVWTGVGTCEYGCSGGYCNAKSSCSDYTSASACSAAGCYWETQLKVCTDNPNATSTSAGSIGGGGNGGGDNGGGGSTTTTIPATGIKLTPSTLTLRVGQSATITATLTPVTSTDKVIWSSDNGKVATVTADGMIKGVAVGATTVRAVTDSGIEAIVSVTILSEVVSDEDLTLSFKVSFAGIKPYYKNSIGSTYSCIAELGDLTVEVLNRPTNTYDSYSGVQVAVLGNEVDLSGNQVFQVTNLEIGSEFASVDSFNNIKVKGPFHLKRRMCKDGQSDKLDENTVCDIDLVSSDYVYDFTKYVVTIDGTSVYGLLAGDVNQDGMINSQDFSFVKNAWAADAEPECGRSYDLNLDGVVNHIDKQLVLSALSFKDDE